MPGAWSLWLATLGLPEAAGAGSPTAGRLLAEVWQREQGLPQNSVHAVVQDRDGYIWMGTDDGLARFDGVSFTVFDRNHSPELVSDAIRALAPAGDGGLWVATRRGLYRFAEGRFTPAGPGGGMTHEDILTLYLDRRDRLWIGAADGASSFDGASSTFRPVEGGLAGSPVRAIHQDRQGHMWFGTEHGLVRLADGRSSTFTAAHGLSHDHVRVLHEDGGGSLWIGTGGGLTRFERGRFTAYTARDGLSDPVVGALEDDGEGGLWVGTGSGLDHVAGDRLTSLGPEAGVPPSLNVRSLWRDREGSLWIGTSVRGAVRLAGAPFTVLGPAEGLADDLVWVVYQDRAGSMWIGTASGLTRLDADGAATTYTPRDGLPGEDVRSLAEDRDGNLWVGTGAGGLGKLQGGAFEVYTPADGLPSLQVATLLVDRGGALWIGTDHGLSRFAGGTFTTYTTRDGLAHDQIRILYEDARGALWIGTEGGLSRRDGDGFAVVPLIRGKLDERIRSLHGDRRGDLWIGTAEHGLLRYRDGEVTVFSVADGLFDYLVHQILEDDRGSLWMSSNQGVFRVRKSDLEAFAAGRTAGFTSISYDERDGMKSRECNGRGRPAGFRTRDGKLWFPTIKGVAIADPGSVDSRGGPPPVHIVSVVADGRTIEPRQRAELAAGTREVELRFTAPSFLRPDKVRFKFRLEGFQDDWVDAGPRREAYYTNLDPGTYRFRVIAGNRDGVWNEEGDTFELRLLPAFYQTWTFYAACAGATLLLGSGLHRLRLRTVLRHNEELRRMQRRLEAQNAEIEAANVELKGFTYTVSHDLKSPLVTILGFLGYLERDLAAGRTDRVTSDIESIRNAATRMRRLLDELLELSRIGRVINPPQAVDLGKLAREAAELVAGGIAARGVEVVIDPDMPTVVGDRARLLQVMQNLIDNAVKFMGAAGAPRIEIGGRRQGRETLCWVRDNGVGIDPRHHHKVFGLFDQLDARADGTGLGLAMVKRIVEAHGGWVRVESEGEGHGSTFVFSIPAPS